MSFFTAINCMDGRVQLPVINYLKDRFKVLYVDSVTSAGPIRVLSDPEESRVKNAILRRVGISVEKHKSTGIAVVGHFDCAGNPVDMARQREQVAASVDFIAGHYPDMKVFGLLVDGSWTVSEVCARG